MSALELSDYVYGSVPFASAAAGLAWRQWAPTSFWYAVGFPVCAVRTYGTWHNVAFGCGLTKRRRAVRWSLDGVPGFDSAGRMRQRRRLRKVDVDKAPRLGMMRPTRVGFTVTLRLVDGQTPETVTAALPALAHAWRCHSVRVLSWTPGKVTIVATDADPLTDVPLPQLADGLLRVRIGNLETGEPWVVDFRQVPHWFVAGATNSGKSTWLNALILGLAAQLADGSKLPERFDPAAVRGRGVALVGLDLKGGVEFTPYEMRMSKLATERDQCGDLLEDLVLMVRLRMGLCRHFKTRNIWHERIPDKLRPTPIVVLVDEVAELFLMADKSQKDEVARVSTLLLRIAQIARAFGIYLVVCGQRMGSDLGPGVTALRSQLTGRVCHRVNDDATAEMTLGDLDKGATVAVRSIPPDMPGVAVAVGADGRWRRARSAYITEEQAEAAAERYAVLTPSWEDLLTEVPPYAEQLPELDELDAFDAEESRS
ncbi:FtsK/SpoIIIE domain-containing protein [Actinocorallia libanotica]|uniref:FtsK/SpoIIIE domain-containing protein n=1 Tax=Actinocorallia libanotica TaxID=46162 RepID=A0ABN1Q378_9ACTN